MLLNKMNTTVDGEFQRYSVESGAYIREHFFGPDPRLRQLVAHLSRRRPALAAPRRPRLPQALRGLQGGHREPRQRRADGHPVQDDQGLDARSRDRGPQRHPPDQEDDRDAAAACCATGSTCRTRSPTTALDGDVPPYYRPPEDSVEYQYMMERRRALDGSLPRRVRAHPPAARAAGRQRRSPRCSPARARRRVARRWPSPACCANLARDEHVRPARRADHPRRGPHVRHGRAVPRAQDLRRRRARSTSRSTTTCCSRYTESADGQILEEGITEAGVDGQLHRRRHELRHPRRADGALLHLLFDVRLPARRRPHLAGRRRPHPRLPARAPPPGARRCSARACSTRTATASCSPRPCRRARPTTRPSPTRWPRSCKHGIQRMYGPTTPTTRRLLLPHPLQRELPDAGRCRTGPASTDEHRPGPVPVAATAPEGPSKRGHAAVLRLGAGRGPPGGGRAGRALRRRRRAVVGHVVQGAARGGARPSSAGTACTPASRPARPLVARLLGRRAGPDRRRHRLHEDRARADRPVPARPPVRAARHRRLGPLRHPRGAAPVLRGRRRPRRRRRACRRWPSRARSRRRSWPTPSPATASTPTRPTPRRPEPARDPGRPRRHG